jgi:dipeptidyl aminopeptidase/acylaminoacyl peptidase
VRILRYLLLLVLFTANQVRADKPPAPPRTTAEKSDYQATTRHVDVVAFCEAMLGQSNAVKLDTLGTTHEGRKIPLMIVADPPVSNPSQVGKRTVVAIVANIHAGEVDGKEALLMLAREIATGKKESALLKDLVLLIVPNFNADGNEKLGKNRPEQNGPAEVGTRANAQGLDLNRDFIKLETPEVQALVRLMNTWEPAVLIDMHTTDGSFHRYAVTYDGPRHPATDSRIIGLARDTLLPAIGKRMLDEDKLQSFFYGNFSRNHTRWTSYPPLPRYGIAYVGLRNRLSILCESYNYDSFKDRVRASHDFVYRSLEKIAENRDRIRSTLSEAREATVRGGKKPRGDDQIALRFRTTALKEPATILGFVEETKDGKTINTGKPRDYKAELILNCEPTLSVARPYAYLFPATFRKAIDTLQRHSIDVEELREDLELDVEVYRIDKRTESPIPYQKHNLVSIEATVRKMTRPMPARTILVRTAQPLGTLACYLLEPQAEDGLAAWNLFDPALAENRDFPVLRLPAPAYITSGKVRPLKVEGQAKKKITLDEIGVNRLPNFAGSPVSGLTWLEDGEHFLQVKDRQLLKVQAATGRATPFLDHEKLARCLASIPGISKREAEMRSRSSSLNMNKSRTGILVEQETDLYYCSFDSDKAVRLTKSPGRKELATFSPDGKHVSFVRDGNLVVVDIAGKAEKSLTNDGSEVISSGKTDWVYFEEINNRNWNAHWWSPDSKYIAFLRFDDTKLKKFAVVDQIPLHQNVELTRYPLSGDPNPTVKLGTVTVDDGKTKWVPLGDKPEELLVTRVGWTPDSANVVHSVQDRTQTWLEIRFASPASEKVETSLRDKTKAWIEDPGPPSFLKDGSYILPREESGWRHLYHLSREGKVIRQLTTGKWEAKSLQSVDEENGWVYFLGMRDSYIGQNLYRVKLDGSGLALLTSGHGDHLAQVSPKCKFIIDTWSDLKTPTKVQLFSPDGAKVRLLDTNPVYAIDDYEFLPWESVQIKMPDGFLLEGMIITPPNADPNRKYPVWVKTYGGPHTPTIKDVWFAGRVNDQALARAGYVVFLVDPRSASGKGAAAAWTAYKQLGVQELKDLESAVTWLCQRPYVDAKRIGLSGHSYGGFLTSYAMTHSKLFAAGIAGAPVTDWHLYDSIYTERYMLTPKENPEGYAKTSVVKAAKDLHGKLLIIHGLMDDNVHVQNTMRFVDELQKANKDFELMIYPRARHPIMGAHYRKQVLEFMQRALKPGS